MFPTEIFIRCRKEINEILTLSLSWARVAFSLRGISRMSPRSLKYLNGRRYIVPTVRKWENRRDERGEDVRCAHLEDFVTKWRRRVGDTDLLRCISLNFNPIKSPWKSNVFPSHCPYGPRRCTRRNIYVVNSGTRRIFKNRNIDRASSRFIRATIFSFITMADVSKTFFMF